MKTLIITLEYPPQIGGIASYVYNFVKHYSLGEVMVYAPTMPGGTEFDIKNSWKTIRLKPFWGLRPRWFKLLLQLRKIIKQEQISELFVHHVLPVGYVAYLLKKNLGISYTIFLHGTDLEMATNKRSKTKKFAKICLNANRVVVNSEFLKNKLSNKVEGLKNVVVLYPCPGDQFLQPTNQEELEILRSKLALNGKKVLLTVARMAEGKGFPHLIRLLPQILQKVPNLVWLVIGDGPKRPMLVDMVQQNSLQNVTRFLGVVPYEDLAKYYKLADLFVLLTHKDESSEEGWGTVFLEAAASSLPVVAGRVGGVEEVVDNLRTGILVDVYQDMSVVSGVADLLREEKYAKELGMAGHERVLAEFTWEKQIDKLK